MRIVLAFVALLAGCVSPQRDRPYNVLFIAVDDWNDWVGCLGHDQAITPNVDRLAARGLLFTNAHCAAPVCNPSRVAVMTGQRPETTGVYENATVMRDAVPDVVTIPQHFRANGYVAHGGGKIYHDTPRFHDAESFDSYFWWHPNGALGNRNGRTSPYSHPPDPQPGGRPTRRITPITKRNFDWGAVDRPESDWPDVKVARWASSFLGQNHEPSFFLATGIFRPHVPWFNPTRYVDLYDEATLQLPDVRADDLDDLGTFARNRAHDRASKHAKLVEYGEWRGAVRAYLASISFADANVGRVLDALDRSPHKDNTIVVFWSDHGYHLGEKGHWHKRTLWERSTRVPFIIVAPGITTPGTRCERPVNLLDIYPTLVELCGLPPRTDLDGRSLVPLLRDPRRRWDHPSITTWKPGNVAARSQHFRYIRYANGEEELYDHRADPDEWQNLAGKPGHRRVVEEHRKYLPEKAKKAPPRRDR